MSNNFLQWNPAAVNQQDDSAYTADAMRTGGAVTGIFASDLANKLFYQCTTMVSALGESLSNKGYTISDASISTLITALSNILTKADFGTSAGTVCQGNDGRFSPAGTKMWFYQNTAPSGWVIDANPSDAVLAVKGASGAYNVNGGQQAGTWTQPNHAHTGPSHTHTTGDCTLALTQIPPHDHTYGRQMFGVAAEMYGAGGAGHNDGPIRTTSRSGGGQPHNHGATGAAGTGDTSASATAATWRPLAQVGIICVKS